jgi:hypothetical protein
MASPLGECQHGLRKNRALQKQRDQECTDFGIRDLRGTTVEERVRRRGNRHDITPHELFTTPAELVIRAIDFIGGASLRRNIGCSGALQHLAGQLQLGRERYLVGNVRFPAALPVVGPGLGQVSLPIDQRVTFGSCIRQKDADLTVFDPTHRRGIHPCHPDTLGSLLENADLIQHQHQHAVFIAEMFDHRPLKIIARRVGISLRTRNTVLEVLGRFVPPDHPPTAI